MSKERLIAPTSKKDFKVGMTVRWNDPLLPRPSKDYTIVGIDCHGDPVVEDDGESWAPTSFANKLSSRWLIVEQDKGIKISDLPVHTPTEEDAVVKQSQASSPQHSKFKVGMKLQWNPHPCDTVWDEGLTKGKIYTVDDLDFFGHPIVTCDRGGVRSPKAFDRRGNERWVIVPPDLAEVFEEEQDHSHYYRDCPYDRIDVYRVIDIFEITDPCMQHAVKKILCAGDRGHKDTEQDVKDVIDSMKRWQDMRREEANV